MKVFYASLCCLGLLCGCSTLTNRVVTGRDFDEGKVNQIRKGVTTASAIAALYGEPDSKEILSANDVMWHYTYVNEEHKTRSAPFTATVTQTSGYRKRLDILLRDDVVLNFTYVKAPIQAQAESSGAVWSN